MSLTRAAIEKDRITLAALVVVLAAGAATYRGMPRAEDPGFLIRVAMVTTNFPGASPERVEQLITDKLEQAIQEMPQVDVLSSESKTGASVITVELRHEIDDLRPVWDELRRKVEGARRALPDGVIGPFVNDEFGDVFGTLIAVTGDGFGYAELEGFADEARDELLRIPEVAKVEILGAQEERVFVEYSNATLSELGLSPVQLRAILESQNIILPGGDVQTADETIVLEPTGNFETLDDLRRSVVNLPGRPELLQLGDIARVYRGYVDPPRSKVRATGEPALALAISMREGGNILRLGEAVRATLGRVEASTPVGIEFELVQLQSESVDRKIRSFMRSLLQAVAIVMLVMLASLGVRTGLVVASLIPTAIVMAIFVMGLAGIGLDQMSLASLIIALGMLVDNAIVMSESIMVQMAEGRDAVEAAVDSAAELKVPLLTSSLTTAAAFLPIYLAESNVGEYTAPLFSVVTITLLCSWVLSLTLVPLLCVRFLRVPRRPGTPTFDSPFYRGYRRVLLGLLRRPLRSLAGVALVLLAAVQAFAWVPVIFFPPNDRPSFTAELRLPTGTPLSRTEAVARAIEEEFLAAHRAEVTEEGEVRREGITGWAFFLGRGAPRFVLSYNPIQPSSEYGIGVLNASSREVIDELVPALQRFCFERFPDLKAQVRPLQNGPAIANPIEVRIGGRDTDRVFAIAERIKERLRQLPGPTAIDDDWGARSKKLVVRVDEARARRAGVSNQDVAVSLQTMLSGFETTEFREDDEVIPVTMRTVAADRQDLGKIESLSVYALTSGRAVPLKQVADVEVAWQPANVRRRDRLRTVTVQADLLPGFTATQVNAELVPWLEEEAGDWPLGTNWALGGEAETSIESNRSIAEKLPIAALIIVLLLVGQFNSFRRPLIILMTIPLAIIGVVIGLLVMRSYFGFMTLLGIISLAGIVINNAIVLLDRIRIEIEDNGLEPTRAVLESAQRRLRPILLTTFTTLGGLIPLYLGGGPMWEPMAVAIIFGLLFATVLTLGVVPLLYSVFFRVSFRSVEA